MLYRIRNDTIKLEKREKRKGETKMIRVAINGFGRIGRLAFRLMEEDKNFELYTIVFIFPLAGADITTCFAPAFI